MCNPDLACETYTFMELSMCIQVCAIFLSFPPYNNFFSNGTTLDVNAVKTRKTIIGPAHYCNAGSEGSVELAHMPSRSSTIAACIHKREL